MTIAPENAPVRSGRGRVLLTGASGWLGGWLAKELRSAGWEVVGLSRKPLPRGGLVGDLRQPEALAEALRRSGPFVAVVHGAVQPHRFTDTLRGRRESSPELVAGLLTAWRQAFGDGEMQTVHGLLLSTVSVYGEADRTGPIGPDADLRPPTAYGRGKRAAEASWTAAGWGRRSVLRLGPVYARDRLRNVAVRSYLPGGRVRLHLRPPPQFSLCAIETLGDRVRRRLREGLGGASEIENVVDPTPWTSPLVDQAFGLRGPCWTMPAGLPRAGLRVLGWLPGTYGLRCLLSKRFADVVYR